MAKYKKPTFKENVVINGGDYKITLRKLTPRRIGGPYEYQTIVRDTVNDEIIGNLSVNGSSNWKWVQNMIDRAVEEGTVQASNRGTTRGSGSTSTSGT